MSEKTVGEIVGQAQEFAQKFGWPEISGSGILCPQSEEAKVGPGKHFKISIYSGESNGEFENEDATYRLNFRKVHRIYFKFGKWQMDIMDRKSDGTRFYPVGDSPEECYKKCLEVVRENCAAEMASIAKTLEQANKISSKMEEVS